MTGKSQNLSQPSKIISSSGGTSAHEGQQIPSDLFHGENKTHETTVTWRSAVICPPSDNAKLRLHANTSGPPATQSPLKLGPWRLFSIL